MYEAQYQEMIKKKMKHFAKRKVVRKFDTAKLIKERGNGLGLKIEEPEFAYAG